MNEFRFPFCSASSELKFQDENVENGFRNETAIWTALSPSCRVTIIGTIGIASAILLVSMVTNLLAVASSCASRRKALVCNEKLEEAKRHNASFNSQVTFRIWLAITGLISSCVLLPILAATTYYLLKSTLDDKLTQQRQLPTLKNVSGVCFHIAVLFHLYAMLGAVLERWFTLLGLQPRDYMTKQPPVMASDKISNEPIYTSGTNTSTKTRVRHFIVGLYIFVAISICVTFAVVVTYICKVRFLLYGEYLTIQNARVFTDVAFVAVLRSYATMTAILYIIFVFLPTLCLLISLLSATICLYNKKKAADKLHLSNKGKPRKFSSNKTAIENYTMTGLGKERKASESKDETTTHDAGYSHRSEHSQQVVMNYQETSLADIITDSIQIPEEPSGSTRPRTESHAPLPPSWLKYPTIERRLSQSSALKVDDLASISTPTPFDKTRSFLREITETRAVLVTVAVMCFWILPLIALLATDVLAGSEAIFSTRNILTPTSLAGHDTRSPSAVDSYRETGQTVANLSAIFLAMYIIGGSSHFVTLYFISPTYRSGTKIICCKSKQSNSNKQASFVSRYRSFKGDNGSATNEINEPGRNSNANKIVDKRSSTDIDISFQM